MGMVDFIVEFVIGVSAVGAFTAALLWFWFWEE